MLTTSINQFYSMKIFEYALFSFKYLNNKKEIWKTFFHNKVTMSRAHMLYDNKALSTLPVKVTNWKEKWIADEVFKIARYVLQI